MIIPDVPPRGTARSVSIDSLNANQGNVIGPEGIRLEVFGEPTLTTPVQMNHIHFRLPEKDIPAIQAWYAKMFGWIPSMRESVARPGNFMAATPEIRILDRPLGARIELTEGLTPAKK